MAGIPVHTDSPINPDSPKTTAARPNTTTAEPIVIQNAPAPVVATTTATTTSRYQPAQPGAAAVPAPTSTAAMPLPTNPMPTRTIRPPATGTASSNIPAPPQPGQIPSPYTPSSHNSRPSVPPPPKAGEMPSPSKNIITPTANPSMPPHHFSAQPPHTTAAADLSHPPGYSQNVHGSFEDRTPSAGETIRNHNLNPDLYYSNLTPFYSNMCYSPTRSDIRLGSNSFGQTSGGGILGNNNTGEDESLWDTAAKMVKAAGNKLSEGEQQIWKMVNGADK